MLGQSFRCFTPPSFELGTMHQGKTLYESSVHFCNCHTVLMHTNLVCNFFLRVILKTTIILLHGKVSSSAIRKNGIPYNSHFLMWSFCFIISKPVNDKDLLPRQNVLLQCGFLSKRNDRITF